MSILHQLATALEPWKTYYADHETLSTAITATHIAAIVVGGGLAVAADRMTLRVRNRAPLDRDMHAKELRDVHRPVLVSLALVVVSGLLMAASDVEEFAAKPIFWIKMGLIVVLLINGLMLQKTESSLISASGAADASGATAPLWSRMSVFARISMFLWVTITVAGVWLAS